MSVYSVPASQALDYTFIILWRPEQGDTFPLEKIRDSIRPGFWKMEQDWDIHSFFISALFILGSWVSLLVLIRVLDLVSCVLDANLPICHENNNWLPVWAIIQAWQSLLPLKTSFLGSQATLAASSELEHVKLNV